MRKPPKLSIYIYIYTHTYMYMLVSWVTFGVFAFHISPYYLFILADAMPMLSILSMVY